MEKFFIQLPHDPQIQFGCTLFTSSLSTRKSLIVFVNGMDTPQTLWYPTVKALVASDQAVIWPSMLTFDRPGQGTTTGRRVEQGGRRNDCFDAAQDLHGLITQIRDHHVKAEELILVASSVGCSIARIFTDKYAGSVSALLLLDPEMANTDIIELFPNPDELDFDASKLPGGVTVPLLRQCRQALSKVWHAKAPTREGLWRGNQVELLPWAHYPKLKGPTLNTPYVTILEHDTVHFPEYLEKVLKLPREARVLNRLYPIPAWHQYMKDLITIAKPNSRRGPIEVPGAGHLIHVDNPKFVGQELARLLAELQKDKRSSHI